jgi:hypothetical protein
VKESAATLESRKWKKAVYEETKDMGPTEALEYIYRKADEALESAGIEKVPAGKNTYALRKRAVSKVSEGTED